MPRPGLRTPWWDGLWSSVRVAGIRASRGSGRVPIGFIRVTVRVLGRRFSFRSLFQAWFRAELEGLFRGRALWSPHGFSGSALASTHQNIFVLS